MMNVQEKINKLFKGNTHSVCEQKSYTLLFDEDNEIGFDIMSFGSTVLSMLPDVFRSTVGLDNVRLVMEDYNPQPSECRSRLYVGDDRNIRLMTMLPMVRDNSLSHRNRSGGVVTITNQIEDGRTLIHSYGKKMTDEGEVHNLIDNLKFRHFYNFTDKVCSGNFTILQRCGDHQVELLTFGITIQKVMHHENAAYRIIYSGPSDHGCKRLVTNVMKEFMKRIINTFPGVAGYKENYRLGDIVQSLYKKQAVMDTEKAIIFSDAEMPSIVLKIIHKTGGAV